MNWKKWDGEVSRRGFCDFSRAGFDVSVLAAFGAFEVTICKDGLLEASFSRVMSPASLDRMIDEVIEYRKGLGRRERR